MQTKIMINLLYNINIFLCTEALVWPRKQCPDHVQGGHGRKAPDSGHPECWGQGFPWSLFYEWPRRQIHSSRTTGSSFCQGLLLLNNFVTALFRDVLPINWFTTTNVRDQALLSPCFVLTNIRQGTRASSRWEIFLTALLSETLRLFFSHANSL